MSTLVVFTPREYLGSVYTSVQYQHTISYTIPSSHVSCTGPYSHVIHLYVNGDVCKESGVVRNCQVKFK